MTLTIHGHPYVCLLILYTCSMHPTTLFWFSCRPFPNPPVALMMSNIPYLHTVTHWSASTISLDMILQLCDALLP